MRSEEENEIILSGGRMNNAEIQYLERMYNRSIDALKSFILEEANDKYIFSSRNRAEFNRLRLEITKELLRLENKMYKRG